MPKLLYATLKNGTQLFMSDNQNQINSLGKYVELSENITKILFEDMQTHLRENEIFYLKFSESEFNNIFAHYVCSINPNSIEKILFKEVNCIFCQDKNSNTNAITFVYLQKITAREVAKKPIFGNNATIELNPKFLFFPDKIHAIIDVVNRKVLFSDIKVLISIIPSLERYYRSATDEEVTKFVSADFITLSGLNREKIGINNLRKMAIILDSGLFEQSYELDSIRTKLERYSQLSEIEIIENKFVIKENKHLTLILSITNGEFFIDDRTGEVMIAGSKRKAVR